MAKTVASPRIIVNNNKSATISDGKTVTTAAISLGNTVSPGQKVEPKLTMSLTPQVTTSGSVQLKSLTINKNSFDGQAPNGTITTTDKQISTDVLVDSGSTLVLGGVYRVDSTMDRNGIPLLKDLPFIGQLFRTDSTTANKSELMVFITPQILDPLSPGQGL